jgi:hypothetical protein
MTLNDRKTNLKAWNKIHCDYLALLNVEDADLIFSFGSFMARYVESFERFPTTLELQEFKYLILFS